MEIKNYIYWDGIKFINKKKISFFNDILNANFITVPSAPVLVSIHSNHLLHNAIKDSDFSIIDSSLFAILCRFYFLRIYKYSGYRLVKDIIDYLKKEKVSIFLIDPSEHSAQTNKKFILQSTSIASSYYHNYVAPFYNENSSITDNRLLEKLELIKPRLIIIGIAGGKQEILGAYLKRNLTFETTILCTGAALSFFTGEQALISCTIDRMYLGWLFRILNNPKIFLPRYLSAIKFILIFFQHPVKKS
ncbi:MAG: WecB/TagA/CpsF family glycosyltransferase [Melioribacteraceae bacterium]